MFNKITAIWQLLPRACMLLGVLKTMNPVTKGAFHWKSTVLLWAVLVAWVQHQKWPLNALNFVQGSKSTDARGLKRKLPKWFRWKQSLHGKRVNEWSNWSDTAGCSEAVTPQFNVQERRETKAPFKGNLLGVENCDCCLSYFHSKASSFCHHFLIFKCKRFKMYTVEQEILLARHQNDQLEMYITLRMSQYFKDQLSSEEPNNPGPTFFYSFYSILLYSTCSLMSSCWLAYKRLSLQNTLTNLTAFTVIWPQMQILQMSYSTAHLHN